MRITLTPVRIDQTLAASKAGDVLTLNGTAIDLTGYDAAAAPSPWIVGQPEREAGVWHLTLILPHSEAAPEKTRFPTPLDVLADGPIALPPYTAEENAQ